MAHGLGALGGYHRHRNAETLTVVLFHRVLPRGGIEWMEADHRYTIDSELFAQCLAFFKKHYAVVNLADVRAALWGERPLPRLALLITFDDGWRDTLYEAAPALRAHDLPATLFAAADAIADPEPRWWQETLLRVWREGHESVAAMWSAAGDLASPPPNDPGLSLLLRYGALADHDRTQILRQWRARHTAISTSDNRQMLLPRELEEVQRYGISVASHGAAHLPLSMLPDPAADLERARDRLADWGADGLAAISFPHGRFHEAVTAAAGRLDHRLMFTSDRALNAAPGGWLTTGLLSRVYISGAMVSDSNGRLAPHRLAAWLFRQPRQAPLRP